MNPMPHEHPELDRLRAFSLGRVTPAELAAIEAHLQNCPSCCALLEETADEDPFVSWLLSTAEACGQASGERASAAFSMNTPRASSTTAGANVSEGRPTMPGYEILEELGAGGMAVVYKARQIALNRHIALKVLLAGAHARPDALVRFRREAETIARLKHPHIVQVYDSGTHGGLPYIVLELVEGGNLAERTQRQPQPPRQAAELVEKLARAIHATHQEGIVHRDLKPANILLASGEWGPPGNPSNLPGAAPPLAECVPKITDFGLAHWLDQGVDLTLTGVIAGTPAYMAPEQATGRRAQVGPASDVYSLGAILYELLTGRPPFQGTTSQDTLAQVCNIEPVWPSRLQPKLPRDLEVICLKCLEKDPGRRYASALALAHDLHRFLSGEPIQARPISGVERLVRWARHHKGVAAALTVVGLLLVVVAVGSTLASARFQRIAKEKEAERLKARAAQQREAELRKLADQRREELLRALYYTRTILIGQVAETDGGINPLSEFLREWQGLAAVDDPRAWEWFYFQALVRRDRLTLRGHVVDVLTVAWSPDGRRLASGGWDRTIRIWDPTTGKQLHSIPAQHGVLVLAWSPDSKRLASGHADNRVRLWDPATGKELRSLPAHAGMVYALAWHPGGRRLAAVSGNEVVIRNLDNGTETVRLQGHEKEVRSVCWSPDGKLLATGSQDQTIRLWDAASGQEQRQWQGHKNGVATVCWRPGHRQLASCGADQTAKVWDADSGRELLAIRDQICPELRTGLLGWSPDGTRLAGAGPQVTVKVWDARTGQRLHTFLGHTGDAVSSVSWSPDGTHLASGSTGWNGEVRTWPLDASAEPLTISVGQIGEFAEVSWSPDGRKLASAGHGRAVKLWDAQSGRPMAELDHVDDVWRVRWSPDGTKLASAGRSQTVTIWDAQSGRKLAELRGPNGAPKSVNWSPDGRRITVGSGFDTPEVFLWDVATGKQLRNYGGFTGVWSPEGRQLAIGGGYRIVVDDGTTFSPIRSWSNPAFNELVCWSPDGQSLASAHQNTVDVRDATTGRVRFRLVGHAGRVNALAWSPDGRRLVTGAADHTVRLWDAVTGSPVLTLRGHTGSVQWVAWSPDGVRLASISSDGTLKVRDARRGYEAERSSALLPLLDARLPDPEALKLRAGVYARQGDWHKAAADLETLCQSDPEMAPVWVQVGWWVTDVAPQPDRDPFAPGVEAPADVAPPSVPRWYVPADDPNGYVPLAKGSPYYLMRVYAPNERQVRLTLGGVIVPQLWLNGAPVTYTAPMTISLRKGWNTLSAGVTDESRYEKALSHPRVGLYVQLAQTNP